MTVEELLIYGKSKIHSDISKILLAELLSYNPLEMLNHLEETVEEDIIEKYKKEVEAILNNEPMQYVIGNVNFYGNKFYIDKRVLIPRFETEELVENTIEYVNKYFDEPIDIIDLGCGSGNIGITLEKKINVNKLDLVDISTDALEVAKINIKNLNSKANILQNDMLDNIINKYDLIISNPPYIKEDEEIEEIVKNNEPHLALYAKEDGLFFYKKILKNVKKNLKDRSIIAFEIGSDEKDDIIKIIREELPNSQIITKKDLQQRDRMIFIFNGINL